MQEDALVIPALGPPDEVFAVLDCTEEDLHAVVEMEKSLGEGDLTMKAAAADCAS